VVLEGFLVFCSLEHVFVQFYRLNRPVTVGLVPVILLRAFEHTSLNYGVNDSIQAEFSINTRKSGVLVPSVSRGGVRFKVMHGDKDSIPVRGVRYKPPVLCLWHYTASLGQDQPGEPRLIHSRRKLVEEKVGRRFFSDRSPWDLG
jgi:hypothetical protein